MGMVYPRYQRGKDLQRNQEPPRNEASGPGSDGLAYQVLAGYEKGSVQAKKTDGGWLIEKDSGTIKVREYSGDLRILKSALEWWSNLREKDCPGIPELVRTNDGGTFVEWEGKVYYALKWPEMASFCGKDPAHLIELVRKLGSLHKHSKGYYKKEMGRQPIVWHQVIQDRLTQLLSLAQYLKNKRPANDFERLFTESFDFFYEQGQEALQNMVLAGWGTLMEKNQEMILNAFLPHNLGLVEGKLLFLDFTSWQVGPQTTDLTLVLNSYLPQHQWSSELMKDLLREYQEAKPLTESEKHLLLALLRFPNRYWLYAYQYINNLMEIGNLAAKLISYILECQHRDSCLDQMDKWLWEV